MGTSNTTELDWLLDDLVARLPGAQHAVVVSTDGLLIGRSRTLSQDDGEHLSALTSAFHSLARGFGRHFAGGTARQTVVELDHALLMVTAAGSGACLALIGKADADLGILAYEMNLLVGKVGRYLSAPPRATGKDS